MASGEGSPALVSLKNSMQVVRKERDKYKELYVETIQKLEKEITRKEEVRSGSEIFTLAKRMIDSIIIFIRRQYITNNHQSMALNSCGPCRHNGCKLLSLIRSRRLYSAHLRQNVNPWTRKCQYFLLSSKYGLLTHNQR